MVKHLILFLDNELKKNINVKNSFYIFLIKSLVYYSEESLTAMTAVYVKTTIPIKPLPKQPNR